MNGTNRKLPAAKTGQGHGPLYIRGPSVPFRPGAFPEGSIPPSAPPPATQLSNQTNTMHIRPNNHPSNNTPASQANHATPDEILDLTKRMLGGLAPYLCFGVAQHEAWLKASMIGATPDHDRCVRLATRHVGAVDPINGSRRRHPCRHVARCRIQGRHRSGRRGPNRSRIHPNHPAHGGNPSRSANRLLMHRQFVGRPFARTPLARCSAPSSLIDLISDLKSGMRSGGWCNSAHHLYFKCWWPTPVKPSQSVGLSASSYYLAFQMRPNIRRAVMHLWSCRRA